jgi:multiple antibiotic resistance protein
VLWAYNIGLPAVRIAGGIILLVIALQMLSGYQFLWERDHPAVALGAAPAHPEAVPLAVPLMAGPGAMSTVLVLTAQQPGLAHLLMILLVIFLVSAVSYACYLLAMPLMKRLGRAALVTLSCLMGLILAALAVQFMLDGLREVLPALFRP